MTDRRPTRPKSSWPRRSGGRTAVGKPRRVAITGGIGAGKSEALHAFARHGAAVISSDDIVHDLYEHDDEVRAAVQERFGTTDRKEIARIVFADRNELDWLERLLHPRVRERSERWFEEQNAPLAVAEIPLLYETGGEARFDAVIVISAPRDLRESRAPSVVETRSDRLIPEREKIGRADYVYVNDGSLEELDAWVAGVVDRLTA